MCKSLWGFFFLHYSTKYGNLSSEFQDIIHSSPQKKNLTQKLPGRSRVNAHSFGFLCLLQWTHIWNLVIGQCYAKQNFKTLISDWTPVIICQNFGSSRLFKNRVGRQVNSAHGLQLKIVDNFKTKKNLWSRLCKQMPLSNWIISLHAQKSCAV